MALQVNTYYKINPDEDLPIPLIRWGDWRLIFNCKSNYMEQIASDIWLSWWLIKRPSYWGRLSCSWIQTKEKIKKVVPFVIMNFKGEITKPNIPSEEPSILSICALLPSCLIPGVTTPAKQGPRWHTKKGKTMMWKINWGIVLLEAADCVNEGCIYLFNSPVTSSEAAGKVRERGRVSHTQRRDKEKSEKCFFTYLHLLSSPSTLYLHLFIVAFQTIRGSEINRELFFLSLCV